MADEIKGLREAEYERLSQEACAGFLQTDDRESDEAELWLFVCQKVYGYLETPLEFLPFEGATQAQTDIWNLQHLVDERRVAEFDTIEIPRRLIYHLLEAGEC